MSSIGNATMKNKILIVKKCGLLICSFPCILNNMGQDSLVGTVTCYGLGGPGI